MPKPVYNHRDHMVLRRREEYRSVLDIAPLPAIREPLRRSVGLKDIVVWCQTYFSEKFYYGFGPHQLQYLRKLEQIILEGGKVAIAMPRGSGKTNLALAAVCRAIVSGHAKYVLVIAANKEESKKALDFFKNAFTKNKIIVADFPEAAYLLKRLNGSAKLAVAQTYLGERTNIELSEDKELKPHDRQRIISEGRELLRNFTMPGFILRKHNQFVTDFSFESICKAEPGATEERKWEIDAFNVRFEEKMKWWQKRNRVHFYLIL